MGIFSSNPPSYLGVDLGLGGIKVVELRNNKGRAQLLTYGFAEEDAEIKREDSFENLDRLANILKKIVDKSSAKSKQVIASLPTYTVFDSVITLPFMPPRELKKAIRGEATKLLSQPIDDMILYWNILNQEENLDKKNIKSKKNDKTIISKKIKYLKILLTAAPKNYVNKYIEIFHKAGLRMLSLETAAFALTRSLIGKDKSQVMLVDIGAGSTEIIILNNGLPIFSRSIDMGGNNITKELQKNLDINLAQSEQLKIDCSNNKSQSEDLIKIINKIIAPIINEIKYSMNLYFNRMAITEKQTGDKLKNIEKIIMTGGSSLLFGLNKHIERELKMRIFVGDPWARVIYPQDLKPILDDIGPKFSIAIGLAMREIN